MIYSFVFVSGVEFNLILMMETRGLQVEKSTYKWVPTGSLPWEEGWGRGVKRELTQGRVRMVVGGPGNPMPVSAD